MSEILERLAQAHGIALEYRDIWGALHRVPESTLRALLAAMGVSAENDAEAESALSAFEQTHLRAIEPAVVVRHGERATLQLNLTATQAAVNIGWRLVDEDGVQHAGALVVAHAQREAQAATDQRIISRKFVLPHEPPPGYHRLTITSGDVAIGETLLIVAPPSCYRPAALENRGRVWGPSLQLYGLRSARNWGIGDFTDLAESAAQWVARGASLVGINPVHALFPHNPSHASPYSPSSRLFLNVLYLDVEAVEDFRESAEARSLVATAEFQAALARVRSADLVDYPAVAALKGRTLDLAYRHFREAHLDAADARAAAFRSFCTAGGEALERHALFEALQEAFFRVDASINGWQAWPQAFREPASAEVARFATEHRDRIEYYLYLQWQASLQLGTVAQHLRDRGAAIGLYADLAVSIDRAGAEAWANQDSYAVAASVGAPPDAFNLRGQNWGLPPLIPERLRDAAYAPFIALLRANMRHAAALRIDHVMGLMRLFWIPPRAEPANGAYVHYPLADLLGILALESQRHRCLIVGEDLGTVPDELRDALAREGVVSTRLLLFERQASGEFNPPAAYFGHAVVAVSTHDLPTLAGWWEGRDLALRAELDLFPDEATRDRQFMARPQDRAYLLQALAKEGLLPAGMSAEPASLPTMSDELGLAVHEYLARTPAQLMIVQLEDAIGVREQANLPATVDAHPNWRRKLPLAVEHWPADKRFADLVGMLRRVRD